jgi:peptidoglycan L-alanyl-D-glutamate endopeptidase CwlK
MASPLVKTDILFWQRLLASSGFYKGALDGLWGKKSEAADAAFVAFYEGQKVKLGTFDRRTETEIAGLLPKAQVLARKFMHIAIKAPFVVKILSGTRTYAEQNELYAKGRTKSGPKVTNARGGQSNHNFGIAWDVGIFVDGRYNEGRNAKENQQYVDLAKLVKKDVPGLEWGGDWRSFKDMPHYQLATGKSMSQLRAALEAGKPYV